MKPTIGRIVHYYDNLNKEGPQAAIVTNVMPDSLLIGSVVNLQVFWSRGGESSLYDVPFIDSEGAISEETKPPYAIWPPKV